MLLNLVRNHYQRYRNRASWERAWRRPAGRPWQADTPRPFVLTGFDVGWLAPGMTVLEIGCGHGNTASWLAQRGLKVLGVDISKRAIREARKAAPATDGLTYQVVDICGPTSFGATFDVILDTGCLQHLPLNLHAAYQDNLLRAS
jgi:2-polyprenyl-3-methyl-5-hydroxy-6-metoxy-1,4-benzoquinol methylase